MATAPVAPLNRALSAVLTGFGEAQHETNVRNIQQEQNARAVASQRLATRIAELPAALQDEASQKYLDFVSNPKVKTAKGLQDYYSWEAQKLAEHNAGQGPQTNAVAGLPQGTIGAPPPTAATGQVQAPTQISQPPAIISPPPTVDLGAPPKESLTEAGMRERLRMSGETPQGKELSARAKYYESQASAKGEEKLSSFDPSHDVYEGTTLIHRGSPKDADPLVDLTPISKVKGFEQLNGLSVPKSIADNLVTALAAQAKTAPSKLLTPEEEAQQIRLRSVSGAMASDQDVQDTARAITEGKATPVLSQYSFRDRTKLEAAMSRLGYNQAEAERDWKAVNKFLSTMNGAQQIRLQQAITFTYETLPQIEDAYALWKKTALASGYKIVNKAALRTMANLPGEAGSAASNLQALIADVTSELGTVYKGGNSSTDESLKLAAKNLKAEWNEKTFTDAIARLRRSLTIRKNSITTSEPVGTTSGNPYAPPIGVGAPPPQVVANGKTLPESYKITATGSNGHKIGSNDGGNTWFDVQTGAAIK